MKEQRDSPAPTPEPAVQDPKAERKVKEKGQPAVPRAGPSEGSVRARHKRSEPRRNGGYRLRFDLLVVLGPTASGKTRLGVELARRLSGEIISADSRQVYRGMDIGTGKDLHEYGEVPYHLIDIVAPGSEFNLFQFQRLFLDAFADISGRGRLPVLVGGSGMYLDAVLRGYRWSRSRKIPVLRLELAPCPWKSWSTAERSQPTASTTPPT